MSAATNPAAIPNHPDPGSDRAVGPAQAPAQAPATSFGYAQSHAARVLSLLRKLIDYGQDLARTVRERTAAGALLTIAVHFGTRDFALILARITRGLRLANALEAKLLSRPVRPDSDPAPIRMPGERAGAAGRRAVPRPGLPDVPTAEEIAAALRGRPAAAVIADICRDLGIVPSHPLWREVMMVLAEHGSGIGKLFKDTMDRVHGRFTASAAADVEPWPALPGSYPVAARGTGPP